MVKDVRAECTESGSQTKAGWERVGAQMSVLLLLLWLGLVKPRGSQMVAHEEIQGEGEGASAKSLSHMDRVLDLLSPFVFLSRTPSL